MHFFFLWSSNEPLDRPNTMSEGRQSGIVKSFNERKGMGFIAQDMGGEDLFFHVSAIEGHQSLKENQRVAFTVVKLPRGLQAAKVSAL